MGPHAAAVFPGLLEICADADKLSKTLVRDWLQMYMFKGLPNGAELAEKAADFFADTERHISHSRGIAREQLRADLPELVIENLEDDTALQDSVLSVHHSVTHTLAGSGAVKLIENHLGRRYIKQVQQVMPSPRSKNSLHRKGPRTTY